MHITIIQIGKTKASYLQEAENEYLKRLKAYASVKVITLKEATLSKGAVEAGRQQVKTKEAGEILKVIPEGNFVVCLDEHGKEFTSVEFAEFLRKKRDFEGGKLTFIIGGCYGLSDEILKLAHLKLSFSQFTFTHEIIRTLLLEQLYRAFTIVSRKTYHY